MMSDNDDSETCKRKAMWPLPEIRYSDLIDIDTPRADSHHAEEDRSHSIGQ